MPTSLSQRKILVTGGSGMVGTFLKQLIPNAIYLSSKDCDLTDIQQVEKTWDLHKPDTIIHLAAKVGGIMDNINFPADYLEQNVIMNTNVLVVSKKYKVDRLISILSTCIYPDHLENYPMSENDLHLGPPTKTNFSYGYSKRLMAVHIDSYNQQYGTKYQYLIPCNLYGEFDKYGDNSHFVASLIKKISTAIKNDEEHITLFGTGKPLRQFMYAKDLAEVIKICLEKNIYESFNVSTDENLTIDEIAKVALSSIQGHKIKKINYDLSKPDGQFRKDVSILKLKKFIPEFEPTKLSDGIIKTFKYFFENEKH